ncbi:MAG TPA: hypothetical protein VEJ63_08475, partial [Planctomycetota bacterium]|nr:hypothetical protein [Planctomycetota bacterium]
MQVPNHNAYVNGHLIVIRAPIDGTVNLENLRIGQLVKINSELGRIEPLEAAELEQQQHRLLKSILQNETQIAALSERLARERQTLRGYFEKSMMQQKLDLEFAREGVRRAAGDLNAARHAADMARKNSERNDDLVESGAVQVSVAENQKAAADEAAETVRAREAQLAQAQTQLKAAEQGLQLEAPRTL